MHNTSPLISIIIPSYNRANLITETLESVSKQTYKNWECLVVDDGSTDGTQSIIYDYVKKDSRFHFFQRNNDPKGAPSCRNIGIENANGDFIVFLDSDDLIIDVCLENRIKVINENPNYDFWVFRTGMFTDKIGDTEKTWNILHKENIDLIRFIIQDNPWSPTGPIWRNSTIKIIGGFDEYALSSQDWELHIRALLIDLKYFKYRDNYIDNFYRRSFISNPTAIAYKSSELQYLKSRIYIYEKIYFKTIAKFSEKQINRAFSIRYFSLFRQLYQLKQLDLFISFLNSISTRKIFAKYELLVIYFISINLKNESLNRIKYKILNLLLQRIKPEWYIELRKSTFQC
ncbi:MAG: glycosyltransferase family 2 protein [Bacteroidales bacterium]